MISKEIISKLTNYWKEQNVTCHKGSIGGSLIGTEFAEICELIGMPAQEWPLFQFEFSLIDVTGPDINFGTIYSDWNLYYRINDNICFAIDQEGHWRFANSSFIAFMQMLVLLDKTTRKIQRECPDDTGEDWDRSEIIFREMEASMRLLDPRAFEQEINLWPCLLIDYNG